MKATNIRKGNILRVDGVLYRVMDMDHVTPGKGQAVVQTKLRNLIDGNQTDMRFRSNVDVEKVALETKQMQYLYHDGDDYHFMDTETFEQVHLTAEKLGNTTDFLVPEATVMTEWFEGTAIGVELPPTVDLKVIETAPGIKGATAANQRKPATLETGLVVQVPPFIEEGELIRVNTTDSSYAERAK